MMASSASLKCSSCGRDDFKYKRSLVKHERFNCHAKRKTMGDIENKSELKVMKLSKEETKIVISDENDNSPSTTCNNCQHDFSKSSNQKRHNCLLAPMYDTEIPVITLLSEKDAKQFKADHVGNTFAQVANTCLLTKVAVKGVFPFIFPKSGTLKSNMKERLSSLGLVGDEAFQVLRNVVRERGSFRLPSRLTILLPNESPGLITLKSDLLIPKNNHYMLSDLRVTEESEFFCVTLERSDQGEGAGEGEINNVNEEESYGGGDGGGDWENIDNHGVTNLEETTGGDGGGDWGGDGGGDRGGDDNSEGWDSDLEEEDDNHGGGGGDGGDGGRGDGGDGGGGDGGDGGGGGGSGSWRSRRRGRRPQVPIQVPPLQQQLMNSPLRNPDFLSERELYQIARLTPHQWHRFVRMTSPATEIVGHHVLSHPSRCLAHRYHLIHGESFTQIGVLFRCSPQAIKAAYEDIKFYILMMDPFHSNATILNRNLSQDQMDVFLESIFNSLSPCLQRIIRTMRSTDGRRILPLADDTTYLKVTKGGDSHWQQDCYSGRLNKGHIIRVGTITSPDGRPIAARPGPQIGCTPRGGDELSLARQLDQSSRDGTFGSGFTSLFVGGRDWTMGYNVDLGYRKKRFNLGGSIDTVDEVCARYGVPILSPLREGDPAWIYDASTDTMHQDDSITDNAIRANSTRLATFFRPASEQLHAVLFGTYQVLQSAGHHTATECIGRSVIEKYNGLFNPPTPFGPEWSEASKKSTDWNLALSMINVFHPGFGRSRAEQRQDGTSIQGLLAERVLRCIGLPNLLLSGGVMWLSNGENVDIRVKLTHVNNPVGYTVIEISEDSQILGLGLPQVSKVDSWEMLVLGTGPFSQKGGWSVLTAARCWEVSYSREQGLTGGQIDYNLMCKELPQHLRIAYFCQEDMPAGYDSATYGGEWPSGGAWVVKVLLPPSFNSWRTLSNWHTITLVFSRGENHDNHLQLGPQLSRLIAHCCSCETGSRTNSACRHINAGVTALCSPNSFNTTKRMDARLTDINRPDGHQPTESGPPAVPPPLGQQVNVLCPRPNGRISRDSRAARQESTCQGFFNSGPTPDQDFRGRFRQDLHVPLNRGARDRDQRGGRQGGARGGRGRSGGRNRNMQGHPSTLGQMRNTGQSCYAAAVIQGVMHLGLDLQLTPPGNLPPLRANLHRVLSTICAARRNPRVGPLCPTPLFAALAPCLGNGLGPFSEHRTECAGEFLIALLSELSFQPNSLSLTKEEGMCPLCGVRQEVPHLTHSTMIQLPLPNQVQPIDVGLLLGNVRQNPPVPTLSCTTAWCPAFGHRIASRLSTAPGETLCLHVARNHVGIINGQGKVLTPLQLLPDNHAEWPGMCLKAVLAHREQGERGEGRHWIAYLKVQNIWWKTDSASAHILQGDPFQQQINPTLSQRGFTLDVLLFGQ